MTTPLPLLALTDFSNSADQAMRRAALMAAPRHARLDLMHVFCSRSLQLLQELRYLADERAPLGGDARRCERAEAVHAPQRHRIDGDARDPSRNARALDAHCPVGRRILDQEQPLDVGL